MADKHEEIKWQIISLWSKEKRGRLYCMNQGLATPINGDNPIWFGPLKRKFKGFPDLFGLTIINNLPIYTVVEVKTIAYPNLSEDQISYMEYVLKVKGCAYIAMETNDGYNLREYITGYNEVYNGKRSSKI